jgi:cytochrome c-type biogenesis protein CcmH/NrfG
MGLLLIFLGLLTAGVVADYVAENNLLTAPNETIVLFGAKVPVSGMAPVVGAFLAGLVAMLLIVVGLGLMRGSWGRRRTLKRRIAELEWQNTELRSRERLQEVVEATQRHVVQLPESQAETEPEPPSDAPPSTPEGIGASN